MPQLGYGCYQVTNEEAFFHAIKAGYRNLDTAAFYENEEAVGRQVRRAIAELGLAREDLFISTKTWVDTMGYESTVKAVETALAKLDIGYIDLLFLHFPVNDELPVEYPNHEVDRNESWRAFEGFVDKGLVKHLGISNFLPNHIESLLKVAKIPPSVNQFELHPLYQELDTIASCRKHGIIVQSYSPFAQWTAKLITHPTLLQISQELSVDVARVILAWNIAKGFAVLAKSSSLERIESNFKIGGIELSGEQIERIDAMGAEKFKVEWDPHGYP